MKRMIVRVILACACVPLIAQEYAPVRVTEYKGAVYRAQNYAFHKTIDITNQLAAYRISLSNTKAIGKVAPETRLVLSAGNYGFCPLINFFKISINGIMMREISPNKEDFRIWQDGRLAGCEMTFNYDGAKVQLRLYLRPDSPVLWGGLQPAKNTLEPINKISCEICAIPSYLGKDEKKSTIFNNSNGVYARMAVTPVNTFKQNPKQIPLMEKDSYVILQDANFDGSSADKGDGPVMVILDDYSAIQKATVRISDSWTSTVNVDLKKDFKKFDFGLWQQKPRISNADFAKKLQAEKNAFTR